MGKESTFDQEVSFRAAIDDSLGNLRSFLRTRDPKLPNKVHVFNLNLNYIIALAAFRMQEGPSTKIENNVVRARNAVESLVDSEEHQALFPLMNDVFRAESNFDRWRCGLNEQKGPPLLEHWAQDLATVKTVFRLRHKLWVA